MRNSTLSAFVGRNYAELSHHDPCETGPTIGLRCSQANPKAPRAHLFVYPAMSCGDKQGIVIAQPKGTLTVWFAAKYEHTNSIDEDALLSGEDGLLSVGLVAVQKDKLLSVPSGRKDVMEKLVYLPASLSGFLGNMQDLFRNNCTLCISFELLHYSERHVP